MSIWLDLKTAVRQLRRAPGVALAAVLTLAVGIGSTSAVFSFIVAVMSASSPVDDMDRRVAIWSRNRAEAETKNAVSPGDFVEWRRRATLLDGVIATRGRSATLGGLDNAVRVSVQEVTGSYFEFFRWSPVIGRTFTPADDIPGAPRVIVVSYEFWRDQMASRPDAVGMTVRLDGEPATIVGVLPRMAAVGGIYVPLGLDPAGADRTTRNLFIFARLRDGVSLEQARAEMDTIGQALEAEFPTTHRGWSVNTRPLQEEFIGPQARLAFAILAGAVASVLLIGCVNVANLLLARGFARRGELAVRVALGAASWRIARQLLVECGVIAVAGAAASVLISRWTVQFFQSTAPLAIDSPWMDAGGLNLRALSITGLAAIVATIASGLAPILASRRADLVSGLQASGRSGIRANRRLTASLVAAEIALAVMLLIVSGLLMRTLIAIESLDPGFDVSNTLTATITLPQATAPADASRWFERAIARVRTLPGVLAAGATSRVPFAGSRFNPNRGLEIEGRTSAAPDEGTWAVDYIVTPQLLETLGVRLVEGRTFTDGDGAGAPLVAIVSRAMAQRFWPGRSPVGARLRQGDEAAGEWRTVVGVVGDIRNDDADAPPIPYLYVPLAQRAARTMTLVMRSASEAAALTPSLRRAIAELDRDQALYDVRTMQDVLAADLAGSRVLIEILTAFALIALGLAGLAVWAVAAQSVGQRTREIGVRVALGATARQVTRLMAMQAFVPIAIGLALGLIAGLGVARIMRSVLFQVSPNDPITIAVTIATLATVGLIATLGPALRAARLDPLAALREQ
jgi:putative ABC transport system permease protein